MNLFINAVSEKGYLALFNSQREIIDSQSLDIKGNESSQFIEILDSFLDKNNCKYDEIENIVCVNWPGSFTGVRTIVLVVNTLAFLHNITLTAMSYFELFQNFPIIKSSSKRDCFFQLHNQKSVEIINNQTINDFIENEKIEILYWESNFDFENVTIIENIDYCDIIQTLKFQDFTKIEPLYIKKPNIS